MAYTQGAWRTGEKQGRVPLTVKVSPDFRSRIRALGDQLKGRWDVGNLIELSLDTLEKLVAGEEVDVAGMKYSTDPTRDEMRAKLQDFGRPIA